MVTGAETYMLASVAFVKCNQTYRECLNHPSFFANMRGESIHQGSVHPQAYSPGHSRYVRIIRVAFHCRQRYIFLRSNIASASEVILFEQMMLLE